MFYIMSASSEFINSFLCIGKNLPMPFRKLKRVTRVFLRAFIVVLIVCAHEAEAGYYQGGNIVSFSDKILGKETIVTWTINHRSPFTSTNGFKHTLTLPHFSGSNPYVKSSSCNSGTAVWAVDDNANSGSNYGLEASVVSGTSDHNTQPCIIVVGGVTLPFLPSQVLHENDVLIELSTDNSDDETAGGKLTGASGSLTTDTFGLLMIYFRKSECRVGGFAGGTRKECDDGDTNNCKTCTGAESFVVTTGLQKTSQTCPTGASNDELRCDAMYHSSTNLDIAVNVQGSYGTLTCGAFESSFSEGTPPSLNLMEEPDSKLKAANYVLVDEVDRYNDQVVSLSNLIPDEQYDIFCHMDNVLMSPPLTVWTDINDRVWGVSLVPSTTTAGSSPGTITLTFTHGAALASGNTITLNYYYTSTSNPMFGAANTLCSCDVTSDGSPISTSSTDTHSSTQYQLDIVLSASSAKGSTIVVECDANLANNPTAGTQVLYDLTAHLATHPQKIEKRLGWVTVN
jgi:hypothetical protein